MISYSKDGDPKMTRVSLEYFSHFFFMPNLLWNPTEKKTITTAASHICTFHWSSRGKKDNEYSFTTWALIIQQSKNLNGIEILRLEQDLIIHPSIWGHYFQLYAGVCARLRRRGGKVGKRNGADAGSAMATRNLSERGKKACQAKDLAS